MIVFGRIALTIGVFFSTCVALGAPGSFAYQGQIIKPDGQTLEADNVVFTIEIYSPGPEQCLLYQETHTLNLRGSNGIFSFDVGEGNQTGVDFDDTTTLVQAIQNVSTTLNPTTCAIGSSYTPSGGDGRLMRVTFDDGLGPITLSQDHRINSVPYAQSAASIDGVLASEILRENTQGSLVLNQANLENVFDTANHDELLDLLAGTSSLYAPLSANGAGSLPSFTSATPPAAPSAGDIWFNSDDSQIYYYDGSSNQLVGGGVGTGTVTAVTAGSGLAGGTINTSGTISIATGGVDNSHLASGIDAAKITTGTLPAGVVPSGTDNSKLPLAGGTMTGDINMNGSQLLGSGHITQGAQSTITIGAYTNAEEATLVGTLNGANAGATWYNSDLGRIRVWNGSAASSVSSDDLGSHIASTNIQLGSHYLSGDGDSEGIFVDSDGNVGLGTTNPSSLMELFGASATFRLNNSVDASSYFQMNDTTATLTSLSKISSSGNALIDLNPIASDGASQAHVRLFRSTNSTGTKSLQLMRGDGTAS